MTVAIDGPAGTGKSTVAHRVAEKANLFYLNSGNFYRAITWMVTSRGIEASNASAVSDVASAAEYEVEDRGIRVNGTHLTHELRSTEVDSLVAEISAIPPVREIVNEALRKCAAQRDVIAEGRDMTTVVFPAADVRVYLDASIESRARRRYRELEGSVSLNDVRESIARRDEIDATKPVGALKLDPSALYIDSSSLTVSQVCEIVLHAILSARTKSTTTGAIGQS